MSLGKFSICFSSSKGVERGPWPLRDQEEGEGGRTIDYNCLLYTEYLN